MYRRKLTLELIVKSLASFCFGFLVGYLVFSLIARPNENPAFAEDFSLENPDTTPSQSKPSDQTTYPKTYSDLPESTAQPESTLLHHQKPSFVHLYDYARYYVYYSPTPAPVSEPSADEDPTPEPSAEKPTEV